MQARPPATTDADAPKATATAPDSASPIRPAEPPVILVPAVCLMTATTSSTALAIIQPAFTDAERLALAGFLARYRSLTREAYTLDLRQFTSWCRIRSLSLFAVRRADIETFARELEARGRARATVTRRLCTIAGFYKYAVEEELLEHSPAAHVRRPRLDCESHATALDRNELGAPGRLRARAAGRARADLPARTQRAAGVGGHRRGHRAPRARTRPPDPGHTRRAARSSPSRSRRAPPARSTWLSASAPRGLCSSPRTRGGWTGMAPPGSSAA
jgi:hypothetical protein